MQQNIIAHSGNLLAIEFDGKRFATIQSMSVQDDYGPEPVSGIGDIHVQEYVPSMARHTIQVHHAVLKSSSMYGQSIIGENGCDRLRGLEFDIVIYEKNPLSGQTATGGSAAQEGVCDTQLAVVRKYRHCSMASGSTQIQAHRVVMTDATFNARDVIGRWEGGTISDTVSA